NILDNCSVTTPARPKSNVSASPTTKGGVMIGNMVRSRRPFLKGKPVRVATRAKASPSTVDPVAVISANHNVRHATPHRPSPTTQARLQIEESWILPMKPSGLNEPSKSCTDPTNMLRTG